MPPNVPIVTPDFLFSSSVKRATKSNEFDQALSNASLDSKDLKSADSKDIKTEDTKAADKEALPTSAKPKKDDAVDDALASAIAALLIAPLSTLTPVVEEPQTVTPSSGAATLLEASTAEGETELLVPPAQTLTASSSADFDQALLLAEGTLPDATQEGSGTSTANKQAAATPVIEAALTPETIAASAKTNENSSSKKGDVKAEVSSITFTPGTTVKGENVTEEGAGSQAPSRSVESAPERVEANQPIVQTNNQTSARTPTPEVSATTSPMMARLPEPARHVVMNIQRLVQDGASEVKLQLQPESLGRVEVQLHYDGTQVRVHLNAENANTGLLLQEHSHTLRSALVEAGVSVGQLTVNVGDGRAQHGRQFAAQQQELSNRYRPRQEAKAEPVSPLMMSVSNGRMDLKL